MRELCVVQLPHLRETQERMWSGWAHIQHTGPFLGDVGDRDFPQAQTLQPLQSYMHEAALQSHRIRAYQPVLLTHKATPGSIFSLLSEEVQEHPRAACILGEPGSGGITNTRCLSDLHAVHVDAEVDLELGAHLDDLGHAVQQHVVELGREEEEEERVDWSPAPACSELGASLGSRVLHPPGAELVLGKNPD